MFGLQVAAQNGVSVTLVDVSEDLLTKGRERIETSLKRVAKKQFANDVKVCLSVWLAVLVCVYIQTWLTLSIHIAPMDKSKVFWPRGSLSATKQLIKTFVVEILYSCSLLLCKCSVSVSSSYTIASTRLYVVMSIHVSLCTCTPLPVSVMINSWRWM